MVKQAHRKTSEKKKEIGVALVKMESRLMGLAICNKNKEKKGHRGNKFLALHPQCATQKTSQESINSIHSSG